MTEPKSSEARLQAVKKYKEKVKRITTDFYPTDEDIWNHLQSQPNKQGYIKDLIRKDMENNN